MELIKIINPEGASQEEVVTFKVRTAARAIVYDKDNNIAILNVSKQNYHKLPGGGVEEGEDFLTALKRECLEELGCEVKISGEVGQISEYRKMFLLKQISFCYMAEVVGEKGNPSFTEEESENGFQIQWVSLDEAVKILSSDHTDDQEGKWYIVPRDRSFLEAVKNKIHKS